MDLNRMVLYWLSIVLCFLVNPNTGQFIDGVERIGNDLKASSSGVDVAGAIFLINDRILQDGIVFAFSAYFRSDKPLRFQIWRPLEGQREERMFRLVAEYRVVPTQANNREDVYIESFYGLCTRVRLGDRLGVYMEEVPTAVAYVFDPSEPKALGRRVDNTSDPIRVGEAVVFDALVFPYDFSAAAYVFLDPNATQSSTASGNMNPASTQDPSTTAGSSPLIQALTTDNSVTVMDGITTDIMLSGSTGVPLNDSSDSTTTNSINSPTTTPYDTTTDRIQCPLGLLIPPRFSGTLPPTATLR